MPVTEVCAGAILVSAAATPLVQFCVAHAASVQVAVHVATNDWAAVLKREMADAHVETSADSSAVKSATTARICVAPQAHNAGHGDGCESCNRSEQHGRPIPHGNASPWALSRWSR
ncbi:MAG: hypothetical protein WAV27_23045 [Xanthobacteraceae bacterium]